MANEYLTPQQAQYLYQKLLGELKNDPVDVEDSASIPNNSSTNLCSTASYGPGVYLVDAYASFAGNSTGRRHLRLSNSSAGAAIDDWSQATLAPVASNNATVTQVTTIQKRTTSGKWYLVVYQNSGSALTVSGGIRVLKLH